MNNLNDIKQAISGLVSGLDLDSTVQALNELKIHLKSVSPFKSEPVDCVIWVKQSEVHANDYNPNSVAPPEMELLRTSIVQDGYTQPIVTWNTDSNFTVVDGFHRNRVGKECAEVRDRIHGYLPLVVINQDRQELGDRMVSTIRHNRARGKHSVDSMSDIVVELKRRNWTDSKITKNLGMDADEVLRLCQVSGLTEMFKNVDFSKSWQVADRGEHGESLLEGDDDLTIEEGGADDEDEAS
jgi:ParB-like chromosome segregation protein Spo0J